MSAALESLKALAGWLDIQALQWELAGAPADDEDVRAVRKWAVLVHSIAAMPEQVTETSSEAPGFNADELQLPFVAWKELSERRRASLSPEVRKWLGAWRLWDLACSPMSDDERRNIRYGHYMGWFERQNATGPLGV